MVCRLQKNIKLNVDFVPSEIGEQELIQKLPEQKLLEDKNHEIKAVLVTHNETSTGIKSRVEEIRKAIDD